MDRGTVAVYEAQAAEWVRRRGDEGDGLGRRFRQAAGPGLVADLGCGSGRYLPELGSPAVGLDATASMLERARPKGHPLVGADLESLPLGDGVLAGAFARHSYLHVPKARMPAAMAELRRVLRPGGIAWLTLIAGDYEGDRLPQDDFPGRYFSCWRPDELAGVLWGAGFAAVEVLDGPRDRLLAFARA
ncbi:MAG TPA: class I SAM-dependent methyltransferase [Acidimicrobiales bacterium]|nr:class I SAM-dependent methyltransferase [Acidimicrobiales bacterium]